MGLSSLVLHLLRCGLRLLRGLFGPIVEVVSAAEEVRRNETIGWARLSSRLEWVSCLKIDQSLRKREQAAGDVSIGVSRLR